MTLYPYLFEKARCSESEKRYLLEVAEELYNLSIYVNKNGLMVIDSLLNEDSFFSVRIPQFVMLYYLLDKRIFLRKALEMGANGYDIAVINEFLSNIVNSSELKGRELYEIMLIAEGASLICAGVRHTAVKDILLSTLGEGFLSKNLSNRFLNNEILPEEEARGFLNSETLDIEKILEINITSSILTFQGSRTSITIKRDKNGFIYSYDNYAQPYLEDKENIFTGKPFDAIKITNVLDALLEPVERELNIGQLGLNKAENGKNMADIIREFNKIYQFQTIPEDKIQETVEILGNHEYIKEAVSEYYASNWYDDYPKIAVEIKLSGDKIITLQSNDQHFFMAPWFISSDAASGSLKNYNINISKALADTLPDGFVNKERLIGAGLIYEVIKNIRK
ncbi:MAG: hypothetical protein KA885_03210 [Spirochaetes bacterium]|nr:hypothetical protein [Spirochaetota bacterium]